MPSAYSYWEQHSSIQDLLNGYPIENNGTIIITEGNTVTASNDRTLVGNDISADVNIQGLRKNGRADKLICVREKKGAAPVYGIYSYGRNYFVYIFCPASFVFTSTLTNMAIATVFFISTVLGIALLKWHSYRIGIAIQEKKELEHKVELEKKNKELELAIRQEAAANKAKREFLFNISHDIRTPMNAITGFTSLAATHIDNKEQVVDYLRKISISSQHLLSLINDVLDMSRIESGKVRLDERTVHLPDLIHDIRAIIMSNITAKRLALYIDIMDVNEEDIVTDPLRLNQLLLNILSNAIKFTPSGGTITFKIMQKTAAADGYADYEFRIKDTGVGMSREFREHIFEEFTREESSTVSGIQGTGLGMAISKNIVDMISGTEADDMDVDGQTLKIKVNYPDDEFDDINKVKDIQLTSGSGNTVFLKDIADVRFEDSPASIVRYDKQYQATISASYTDLADKYTASDINTSYVEPKLTGGVELADNAQNEMMMDEFKSLGSAIVIAIFLVFVVMAAQFESPRFSFMVMTTIPFAMVGACGFLWLMDVDISMPTLIGFLVLIGTVVNNGILYVDTVDQLRNEMDFMDAVVEGGAIRLRPIMMTTLTTVLSMLPMGIGIGNSAELMQGLALVNIGGLITSTILALLVLPVYYCLINGRRRRKNA